MPSDEKLSFSKILSLVKDIFVVLREAILPILFLMLLIKPELFNNALQKAGFKEGSFMGLTWKNSAEVSKNIADLGVNLEDVKGGLEQLRRMVGTRVSTQALQDSIDSLIKSIKTSQDKTNAAEKTLTKNMARQQEQIQRQMPQSEELYEAGWIYLGKIERDKTWAPGSPKSVESVSPESVKVGGQLTVSTAVFLRGDVESGWHSSGPTLSVLTEGQVVKILARDESPAKGGGWFIWVKVRRI